LFSLCSNSLCLPLSLRYESRIAADPDNHAMDYTHSYITIEKVEQ